MLPKTSKKLKLRLSGLLSLRLMLKIERHNLAFAYLAPMVDLDCRNDVDNKLMLLG